MKRSAAHLLFLVIVGTVAPGASCGELANSFNIGLGGLNPMPDCEARVYTLEYERRLTPALAIVGRGSVVDYKDDDSDYLEDGRLRGLDIGARYYRAGLFQGLYVGGSLGYWENDWAFIAERNTTNPARGEGDFHAVRLNIDLGYRFPIRDTNISIMPEVNIGKFFSTGSCDYTAPASLIGAACDQDSDVDVYVFAGVTVGIAF